MSPMSSLATKLYQSQKLDVALAPPEFVRQSGADGSSFSQTLAQSGKEFAQTLGKAETAAIDGMSGHADPHAVIEALASAEIALETVVSVRDKAIEAYQEILRMPV